MLQLNDTCLRAVERRDLEITRLARVDPQVSSATLGRPIPVTEENEDAWFAQLGQGAFPTTVVWTIAATDADTAVGMVQLMDVDWIHRTAWFGLWVAPSAQRRGHGRAATTLACQHAEEQLELRQIRLRVVADNGPAVALYRSLGFVDEGVQHGAVLRAGEPADVLIMRRGD